MQGALKNFRTGSQCAKVLEYLQSGLTLTCFEAMKLNLTHNLRSRISDLKNAGYQIKKDYIKANGTYIAKYSLSKDKEC